MENLQMQKSKAGVLDFNGLEGGFLWAGQCWKVGKKSWAWAVAVDINGKLSCAVSIDNVSSRLDAEIGLKAAARLIVAASSVQAKWFGSPV